ncbi:MAG: alpha/beta fold hydrolase [bacterium]
MDLHYERSGEGPGLLLVHGLGGSTAIWRPLSERLAREREIVAVDLPGFGRSPSLPAGTRPTAANLGAAVAKLCDALGLSRPHIAGNSLGAWVALEMAKQDAARSVCGISPAGLWREPLGPRPFDHHALGRRLKPLVGVLARSRRARSALLGTTMAHPERVPTDQARALMLAYISSDGYAAANREMRAARFEHPDEVTIPVTLAWGERDRLVGPPSTTRIPQGARVLTMPGWGHTPTWDDPEGVADLILEASAGVAPHSER